MFQLSVFRGFEVRLVIESSYEQSLTLDCIRQAPMF